MAISEIIKNKKYDVRVAYRDGNGNSTERRRIVNGTQKDAVLVEQKLHDELTMGVTRDLTFKLLFETYHQSKPNVKAETLRKETEIYNKFLKSISNRKIESINPFILITLRNNIEASEGSITQKNKAIYLVKSIYKFGKKVFGINDIASDIEIIKPKVKEKFVYNTLTPAEFSEIITYEKLEVYQLVYEIYFWAGLRRGEALALYKKDLLSTKELDIYQSINSSHEVGPPKNESSFRRVRIHDDLYNRLLPHANSKGVYLLGGETNLAPNTVNRRFKECLERANQSRIEKNIELLPYIRLHDLRHSHATFLASQGVPVTAVSARLGHSSISETMQTYIHLFKGDEERAITAISNHLNSKSTSNNKDVIQPTGNLKNDILSLAKGKTYLEVEKSLLEALDEIKKSIKL